MYLKPIFVGNRGAGPWPHYRVPILIATTLQWTHFGCHHITVSPFWLLLHYSDPILVATTLQCPHFSCRHITMSPFWLPPHYSVPILVAATLQCSHFGCRHITVIPFWLPHYSEPILVATTLQWCPLSVATCSGITREVTNKFESLYLLCQTKLMQW